MALSAPPWSSRIPRFPFQFLSLSFLLLFFLLPHCIFLSPVAYFSLSLLLLYSFTMLLPLLSTFRFITFSFVTFLFSLFSLPFSLSSLFLSLIPCLWHKQLPPITSFFLSLTFSCEPYFVPLTNQSLPDGCIGQQRWGPLLKHHGTLYDDNTTVILCISFTFFVVISQRFKHTFYLSLQATSLFSCDYDTMECTMVVDLDGIAAGLVAGITGLLVTVFTTLWFTISFWVRLSK